MGIFAFRRLRLQQEEQAAFENLRDEAPASASQFTGEEQPATRRRGRRLSAAPTASEAAS